MRTLSSRPPQKSLLKKARKKTAAPSSRHSLTLSMQKSGLAHAELREQTFHLRYGRLYKHRHTHGVELTDDVILLDRQGRRVSTPDYAKVSIDKLPRFQKKDASLHGVQAMESHGVELTDDVVLLDSNGKRIPRVITPISRS